MVAAHVDQAAVVVGSARFERAERIPPIACSAIFGFYFPAICGTIFALSQGARAALLATNDDDGMPEDGRRTIDSRIERNTDELEGPTIRVPFYP
jgi:hypothetical protein